MVSNEKKTLHNESYENKPCEPIWSPDLGKLIIFWDRYRENRYSYNFGNPMLVTRYCHLRINYVFSETGETKWGVSFIVPLPVCLGGWECHGVCDSKTKASMLATGVVG